MPVFDPTLCSALRTSHPSPLRKLLSAESMNGWANDHPKIFEMYKALGRGRCEEIVIFTRSNIRMYSECRPALPPARSEGLGHAQLCSYLAPCFTLTLVLRGGAAKLSSVLDEEMEAERGYYITHAGSHK